MLDLQTKQTQFIPTHLACCEEIQQLRTTIKAQAKTINELEAKLTTLQSDHQTQCATYQSQIQALEDKLATNSRNSSKPSSTDGYDKPAPKSQRKKTGRKPGGQKGHEGQTLEMTPDPDVIVEHSLETCARCGQNLQAVAVITHECRQEVDIPLEKALITEHQAQVKLCPNCAWVSTADFPSHITHSIQYGPNLNARSVYLSQYQFIPFGRLQEFFSDWYDLSISQGTLVEFNVKGAKAFAPTLAQIRIHLLQSAVLHADESGMKLNGKKHWLHVLSNAYLTYYALHRRRGREALEAINLLPHYDGILVHDHWKVYFSFDHMDHALCNSHHIRELIFAIERYQQHWAQKLIDCLLNIKDQVEDAKARGLTELSSETITRLSNQYSRILRQGKDELPVLLTEPDTKSTKQHKVKNLWDRLRDYKTETLRFMTDFRVPFTNNQPEQDIRMGKVKAKISGSFRSVRGMNTFADCRSFISTVKKHKQPILTSIADAFQGKVFVLQQGPP